MRIVSWIVGLLLAALVVDFALMNRDPVLIGLWPFVDGLQMPLYLTLLLSALAGMAIGWSFAGLRHWRRRRAEKKAQQ